MSLPEDKQPSNIELVPSRDDFTPEEALGYCINENRRFPYKRVIVVAIDCDNDVVIRSSDMSRAEANWLVDMVKLHALDLLDKACSNGRLDGGGEHEGA